MSRNNAGLTEDRIITEALRIIDGQGLRRLTMRRLGDALEVEAMAIYHHFPLGKEQLTKIVDVQLQSLRKRLASRRIAVRVSDAAKKLLADEGYDPQFGARPLKRVIQQRIENPLASNILRGEFEEGDVIEIDVDATKHDFTFGKGREEVEAELVS